MPGQNGGVAISGSDEHDEKGLYNEETTNRIKMMDKRFKKLDNAKSEIHMLDFYGEEKSPFTIISLGSTAFPVLEAMKQLREQNINVNFLKISSLSPFPEEEILSFLKKAAKTLIIEGNKIGQLESIIREKTGLSVDYNFRKYDGRPFYPEEIVGRVKSLI